ncbi:MULTISPECIES: hypothetical protein [unclassified Streptomyces]|uniref:hypothetical protein n=1 Tax=unclassified Streptomyces TaxID=2593676 RepID=UPI002E32C76A|nr:MULTISPECIES: hypothetical protein [unclassified Streptomyces]WUC68013.1 hypothetical protein OG861_29355 [Streptomyces sp. NBC_00539]
MSLPWAVAIGRAAPAAAPEGRGLPDEVCGASNRVIMAESGCAVPGWPGQRPAAGRRRMNLDQSQRAWAVIICAVAVILSDLLAIVLMNTLGR